MATINHRKNDDGSHSYVAQVRLKGFSPTSQTFNERDHASRREAEKAAAAWAEAEEQKLRDMRTRGGVRADVTVLKLSGLVDEYLKDPETKKLSTVAERERQLAWWVNKYGSVKALEFASPMRLREAREQLLKDSEPATVNRYLAAARACVNFGRAAGLLPVNAIWPPRMMLREPKARERFLTDAELARVLKAARAQSDLMHALVTFAVGVGCRQSEQLRVRWADINEGNNTVGIKVSKTDTSRRAYLPPAVIEALKVLKGGKVAPPPSAYVFTEGGEAIPQYVLVDRWEKLRASVGLPDVRWHDLRHAAASFLIQNGSTLAEVAHQLGHKNVATSKRYAHLVPGSKPTGADALNAKLSRSG